MVEFWTNHFNVNLDDTPADHMITVDNREVARAHALGRFVDLLQASAHSPAMLIYLNNANSDANSDEGVNENYGRELLELHSMGIIDGVQPYTEADMRGVALTLSGWSVNTDDGQHRFQFKSDMHHAGPINILGGAFVTSGHTGTAGLADGVTLINLIARHPATARYIAYKLCRRFVADTPPPALVASVAAVYSRTTPPSPRSCATSSTPRRSRPGRRTRSDGGSRSSSPTPGPWAATADPDPLGELANHLHGYGWGFLERLGQRLWGHHTPDGYPDTAPDWISADGLLRRWETAGAVTATWLDGWTFDADAILKPTGPDGRNVDRGRGPPHARCGHRVPRPRLPRRARLGRGLCPVDHGQAATAPAGPTGPTGPTPTSTAARSPTCSGRSRAAPPAGRRTG